MPRKRCYRLINLLMILLCGEAAAQVQQESRTLVVNGHTGKATVVQINGRTFVDLENLARVANGSVGFRGKQITLTLPSSIASAPEESPAPEREAHAGLSRNFRTAGIETIARMREWASTLAYAVQNGYGVTENWAAGYREQAASSLNLATTAASTSSDYDALQLLTNEFEAVKLWSSNLVDAKKSMDTAKYSLSPTRCETSLYPKRSPPVDDSSGRCWGAGSSKTILRVTELRDSRLRTTGRCEWPERRIRKSLAFRHDDSSDNKLCRR